MKELLTPDGEHYDVIEEEGLMMMMAMESPLRSPERTPDQPSRERLGLAAAPCRKTRCNFLLDFFLPEREYMELELRLVERHGAHEAGGRRAPTLVDRVWAP